MRLAVGSQQPQAIYARLWPYGLRAAMPVADSAANTLLAGWRSAVYGEHWLLTGSDGDAAVLYCYHVPSDRWTSLPLDQPIVSFAGWQGALDAGEITAAESDRVYALFAGAGQPGDSRSRRAVWTPSEGESEAAYQAAACITAPMVPGGRPGFRQFAKLVDVAALIREPHEAQTLTLSVYADGNLASAQWSGDASVTADSAVTGARQVVIWYPEGTRGRRFSFGLAGEFTTPVECEGLEVTYDLEEVQS